MPAFRREKLLRIREGFWRTWAPESGRTPVELVEFSAKLVRNMFDEDSRIAIYTYSEFFVETMADFIKSARLEDKAHWYLYGAGYGDGYVDVGGPGRVLRFLGGYLEQIERFKETFSQRADSAENSLS